MKHFGYSIYDVKTRAFNQPIFAKTDEQAIRQFSDISQDKEHPVGKHPEDYSLFRIGTFNDSSGFLEPEQPECIRTALECIGKKPDDYVEPTDITNPGGTH